MMKKLLAILLMLMLCAGMVMTANAASITAVKPASGNGTANNPYLISTAAELYWFANAVNQGDYDACARLTADITVNERTHNDGGAVLDNLITWMPIGSGANPYTGTFDGGNHTVSGLYFERSVMYMGFFGSVDRGSVLNLTVADSVFLGRNSFVGMICGQNLEGTITNCHARNCILVGMNCTGGIAGANAWGGTISRCSSDTGITCDGERAGGIAGYNDGAITNCYNTGSMAGDDVIGGIAGYMETTGSISCCYNTGSVIGINTSKNLGGIVGNAMNVTSCYYLNSIGNSLTNQKGKALTAAQMTDDNTWRTNYAGFSTSIWSKDANAGSKAYLPKLNSHSPYLPGFSVTVTTSGSGTASASPKAGATGTPVTLTATPGEGYAFKEWQVVKGGVNVTDNKFTMGSADVEIKAIFEALHTCGSGTLQQGQAATCTADGWADYFRCSCDKLYEDADCTSEITDLAAWKTGDGRIPAGHQYGKLIDAQAEVHSQSQLKAGVAAHYICGACGNYFTAEKAATTLEALTGAMTEHDTDGAWVNTDPDQHWRTCSVCGLEDSAKADHSYTDDQDTTCNDCGYVRTVAPKTYTVTVTTDGNGTASASPVSGVTGTEVSLEVTPNEGYRFVQWQVVKGDVTIGTDHKFTIGSADVEIKAIFEEIPATVYTVTINTQGSGTVTADPASSTAHTDVTLTITPTAGWELTLLEVGGTDVTEHVFNNQFQFTMPESNITVNAVFNEIPPVTYTVTVVNGTGSSEYEEGATVAITADAPAQGKQFSGWTSADVTFADASSASTTFVMPAKAVTVTANYEDIPPVTYTVTVVNGSGSGEYEEGATVAITADAPAQGKQFSGWTSADVTFADATAATTTFVMPAKAVTVTANYEDIPPVTYTVTVTTDGNGTASANPVSGVAGSEVTLTATANEGYIFKEWQVVKGGVSVADNKFTMGSADVEIKAIFEAIPAQPDPDPDPQPDPKPETNPLMIIRHPADQLVSPGETAEFSVLTTGDGLTYQWYINRNDGRGWVKLQGAVNASHTTSPADEAFDGFQYACEVRDMHGSIARSHIAVLYIAAQPDVPATGDSTNIGFLCAMLFISCVGCSLIAANRKRAVR